MASAIAKAHKQTNKRSMDKSILKKFAIWAHAELIRRVKQKAEQYGIFGGNDSEQPTNKTGANTQDTGKRRQYQALVGKIAQTGFQRTMEEAAYTWFSRICMLRFMEVNGYLPSKIRIFTDQNDNFRPQILSGAPKSSKKPTSKDESEEERYQQLIVAQCNALETALPRIFTKLEEDAVLLIPNGLLDKDSVIGRLIADIPESYFNIQKEGRIEIIGWLYQYYFSEKHDEIVDPLHKKFVSIEDVPVATQIFTTEWVVQYIVENSVARYWLEHNPKSQLASELTYYIQPKDLSKHSERIQPKDVTVFDPCVGSGHFLVYAIDILMKIYRECGYSDKDAIAEIITNNIFGLDIDERTTELAYFALMMKGCQYDRSFLQRGIEPNIYRISNFNCTDDDFLNHFCAHDEKLKFQAIRLIETMNDGHIKGSLIQISSTDFDILSQRTASLLGQKKCVFSSQLNHFNNLINAARILSSHYAAVITNPPYLNKFDNHLKTFLQKNYKDYSGDLFSAFIYRCIQFCKPQGYAGLMTPNVWMFIKSYKKLRYYILKNHSITTLVQMAKGAFFSEATVDVCAFVIQSQNTNQDGVYFRLEDFAGNMNYQNEKLLEALKNPDCGYRYHASSSLFQNLPGMPLGYWASEHLIQAFQTGNALKKKASPRQGLATTDNNKYVRHWFEIDYHHIGFGLDKKAATASEFKWFPYNKGGEFRKWYGNQDYIVNYYHDGSEIKSDVLSKYPYLKTPDYVVKNPDTYFKPCLSWSKISSGSVAFRYFPQGFLYDVAGCSIFFNHQNDLLFYAGFLNSIICKKILEIISPTLNYEAGHISILPIKSSDEYKPLIEALVKENIKISEEDWNTMETSWGFKKHSLIHGTLIASKYKALETECNARFNRLKANEEALNQIFINIYGMQNELMPNVEDKDVTVQRANLKREIKSLISYAVGCMFGRYSLNKEGLCYTGCISDEAKSLYNGPYQFNIEACNILPITDDAYFENDIVNRFVEFIRIAYGDDTLAQNLDFIASALGKKGSPRDTIRTYFLNDFYTDHLRTYQKRPIYWLFNSGKINAFKCLIYMHRFQPNTLERIRTDYIQILQAQYQTLISDTKNQIQSAPELELDKLKKQLAKLEDQSCELHKYEEKLHHLADQKIEMDLDDGVKVNYEKFADVLAVIK